MLMLILQIRSETDNPPPLRKYFYYFFTSASLKLNTENIEIFWIFCKKKHTGGSGE